MDAYKLKEIIDLLLAGGYFRARIPALSSFDKVVGGMVWALTIAAVDADIDVIFQENSTIGQKIKISDAITKSLLRFKCPHALQSHQIQGLDLEKIFPVIQWLVKKVEIFGFEKKTQSRLRARATPLSFPFQHRC